ncbi:tRNA uracil 4-sulfurtransferase ThiI [Neptunomonas phycophila]|uniref:Probable tRNA sulfurtransferase n=1 Tax=Neptunomonas phycophila TaxID=1572645 RepID=A0AAW7XLY6_9GAMM|nr:tRNA uracil 4-sulfurtransferase ThiI [Neptunomonas phycophila]MDO6455282.1 tRNA uracil 4-sulfurtransferase ThiI [Neptunomonas phycophila]
MKFIIKLFPEITIKSRPVRRRFIQRLQSNLQVVVKRACPSATVSAFWDKLEVVLPEEHSEFRDDVVATMKRVPGIAHFLEVTEYPFVDFHDAFEKTLALYRDRLKDLTFKVRVKRSGSHDFTSVELERYIGGGLLQHSESAGVDVRKPELYVDLEIVKDQMFIIDQQHQGLGGYPLGSQEAVLSLISGGFDSVVASYMTMRRGSKTHFLFFNLGGKAHEIGVKQVALHLWEQYGASARVKFISVPFDEVVGEILQNVNHSHMGVVLKRQMMRAAEQVADFMGIDALVTGESIAQVSSQTIPNLTVIDQSTTKLIVRPLITMDKQEIVNKTKELGCFDIVKMIPEYCGVISDRPTTKAKLDRVVKEEALLDEAVLADAVERCHVVAIDEIIKNLDIQSDIEALTKVSENQIVVDVRAPHEQEKTPLNMPGCDVISVPFYELETASDSWVPEKEYLLYCDKGVMSHLHAQNLQEKGLGNVKVYRPKV